MNEEHKYLKTFYKDTKAFCRSRYKDMIYNSKPFPLCIKLKAFCKNTSLSKIIFTKAFPELQLSLHNPSIDPQLEFNSIKSTIPISHCANH